MNSALPEIISRIREHTDSPLAVGFGVSTRQHFEVVADSGADGVVVGSRLVSVIKSSPPEEITSRVEAYCRELSLKGQSQPKRPAVQRAAPSSSKPPTGTTLAASSTLLPPRFGDFGGQYVAEALFDCLVELEEAHKQAMADPAFWKEWEGLFSYINRPSNLYFAEHLTKYAGGAKIWMKREDLNHTGSHKINNAIGQVCLSPQK